MAKNNSLNKTDFQRRLHSESRSRSTHHPIRRWKIFAPTSEFALILVNGDVHKIYTDPRELDQPIFFGFHHLDLDLFPPSCLLQQMTDLQGNMILSMTDHAYMYRNAPDILSNTLQRDIFSHSSCYCSSLLVTAPKKTQKSSFINFLKRSVLIHM